MPRRCDACQAPTPQQNVSGCPSCGHQFSKSNSQSKAQSRGAIERPFLPSGRSTDSGERQATMCQYKSLCVEFLKSLEWDMSVFDRRYNHCYCSNCYNETSSDTITEAGSLYVIPRGWCRFGLQVDPVRARVDHIWRDWIVTYHGTSVEAARSIVAHRQFLIPGDKRLDGEKIAILPGHIKEKYHIYTSPTIAYSSVPCYCPKKQFRSPTTNKVYNARIVIQCRQKPGTFQVQAETIGAGSQRICPIIPNSQVEIFTTIRASIVPYGILIHMSEV